VDGGPSGPSGPCGPCGRCGPHCVGGHLQCRDIVRCFVGVSGSVGIADAFLHRFSSNPTDSVSVHNVHIPAYSCLCCQWPLCKGVWTPLRGGHLQCRFIVLCFLGVSGSVGIADAFLHRFSSNPTDSVSVHNVHTVHNVHIPAYSSLCLPIAIMQRGMDPTAWARHGRVLLQCRFIVLCFLRVSDSVFSVFFRLSPFLFNC